MRRQRKPMRTAVKNSLLLAGHRWSQISVLKAFCTSPIFSVVTPPQIPQEKSESNGRVEEFTSVLPELDSESDTVLSQQPDPHNSDTNLGSNNQTLISKEMLLYLFEILSSTQYEVVRKRIAFLFLYHLGIRVGLLQIITVQHVRQLMKGESIRMDFSKQMSLKRRNAPNPRRTTPDCLVLSKPALKQFAINESYISILTAGKTPQDPLFTTEKRPSDFIHVTTLTKELNNTLRELHDALYAVKYGTAESNVKCKKPKLTTHSFRVAFAQRALVRSSVRDVQFVLGHKSPISTFKYKYNSSNQIEDQGDQVKILRDVYEKCHD